MNLSSNYSISILLELAHRAQNTLLEISTNCAYYWKYYTDLVYLFADLRH